MLATRPSRLHPRTASRARQSRRAFPDARKVRRIPQPHQIRCSTRRRPRDDEVERRPRPSWATERSLSVGEMISTPGSHKSLYPFTTLSLYLSIVLTRVSREATGWRRFSTDSSTSGDNYTAVTRRFRRSKPERPCPAGAILRVARGFCECVRVAHAQESEKMRET